MEELSVFIDESGDFGRYEKHSPYYIITMVFHNQSIDISTEINNLNLALVNIGYGNEQAIHTEPLIRREVPYKYFAPNERRAIFSKLYHFSMRCDIQYKSFVYQKALFNNKEKLETRMIRDLNQFFQDNLHFFQTYKKVILYYDNGQHELSHIINAVFQSQFMTYEARKVIPSEYRLFQVADLICTLELLRVKMERHELSNSEKIIFHSKRELKKDFLKGIQKKQFMNNRR